MMMTLIAALSVQLTPAAQAASEALGPDRAARLEACGVDAARLETLLALDQRAFDQDVSGGWRTVAAREGCDAATADLIEVWRDHAPERRNATLLDWRAGQMRAYAGETEAAIALMGAAHTGEPGWDLYVDATIAFLRKDRAALEAAREALARLTPSAAVRRSRRALMRDNPALSFPDDFVERPRNLEVVDRLLACFDGSYAGAYSGRCDAPADLGASEAACAFARQRIAAAAVAPPLEVALAVSPDWAANPVAPAELGDLLAQTGRAREPAPFGFAYDPAFAAATASLTEADIIRISQAWDKGGAIDCARIDTGIEPFTADMAGFQTWAQASMTAPEPGAPDGAATLALTRPVLFDGGARLIVVEQSSYTPIPISRPPSALAAIVIYARRDAGWEREASLVLARGG